jgi:uncharacterized DUF497 family protein
MYIRSVYFSMEFEWDADKSDENLEAREFDFEFATLIFEGTTLEREDLERTTVKRGF